MRVTTKGRYALRAVIALASTSVKGQPVSIKSISEREDISAEFLEQIFFQLRRAGLINSVRGPGGGFFFARPLGEISLMDILEASGEGLGIAPCSCGKKERCANPESCLAGGVWRELHGKVQDYAKTRSLADMLR
ncbi:MAG TPA: Rrf2 family transcriptional regulator [Spirochaetales bacterium]|nr:Rrf2 family transcriptional regulator [Spirochaetales bacterium]HRY53654.1 Rrf2 family transcriptional regulator [Spirochaetia bacterium]HRZ65004.1 Rrf2 family transcriptional regulator [Spirochaetia bacterium]